MSLDQLEIRRIKRILAAYRDDVAGSGDSTSQWEDNFIADYTERTVGLRDVLKDNTVYPSITPSQWEIWFQIAKKLEVDL